MCGLAINIASFVHLLKRVDLDAVVDHLALMYIIKSKVEMTTTRIKRNDCHQNKKIVRNFKFLFI